MGIRESISVSNKPCALKTEHTVQSQYLISFEAQQENTTSVWENTYTGQLLLLYILSKIKSPSTVPNCGQHQTLQWQQNMG